MHPEAKRWNERYGQANGVFRFDPDPQLVALAQALPGRGLALELACGTAGNALWLAQRGLHCVAVDVSDVALRIAGGEALRRGLTLATVLADAAALPFDDGMFQLLVVTRFLERGLFPALRALLAPGGVVFYHTFNRGHLRQRPGFNPDYLLAPGELARAFHGFQLLASNEQEAGTASSYLLARAPGAG